MKLRRLGALVSLLVSSLYAMPIAGAQGTASTAVCVHRWTDSISPGLTITARQVTFTSHGETGTITCIGQVNGNTVTGTGTFGEVGTFRGTCASGNGSATFSFTVPTTAGPATFSVPVTFTYAAGVGLSSSAVFPGTFVVVPTAGDCLLTPVSRIAVVRVGVLQS